MEGIDFIVAVHGGAGSHSRNSIDLQKEIQIKNGILNALKSAYKVMIQNGTSIEAVKQAIITLEDNPEFNAGKGGKINRKFEIELDASIMNGENLKCGAVASVKRIKNPIKSAEKIMLKTEYILLVGNNADTWAFENELEIVNNSYFFTDERIKEWMEHKNKTENTPNKGTVGAVAFDIFGHSAAATSTGGTTYKIPGRVGDSPIIGAGNYANDKTTAVSCTGDGEEFMRRLIAFDIHSRIIYKNINLKQAVEESMNSLPLNSGGVIAVDNNMTVEMPYNTLGMARGYVRKDGLAFVAIFKENEDLTPTLYNLLN